MSSELSHEWKKALILNNCVKENQLCSFIVLQSTSLLIYAIRVLFRQKIFCSLGDFDNTWQHFWFPWLGKERYWQLARKTRDAAAKKSYSTQIDPHSKELSGPISKTPRLRNCSVFYLLILRMFYLFIDSRIYRKRYPFFPWFLEQCLTHNRGSKASS